MFVIVDESLFQVTDAGLVRLWWNALLPHRSEPWVCYCGAGLPEGDAK